jgi:hypothetical protein
MFLVFLLLLLLLLLLIVLNVCFSFWMKLDENLTAKIADFGVSREKIATTLMTRVGTVLISLRFTFWLPHEKYEINLTFCFLKFEAIVLCSRNFQ